MTTHAARRRISFSGPPRPQTSLRAPTYSPLTPTRALDTLATIEHRSLPRATLGALGVVYGDIGTSPLYALKETIAITGSDEASILGVLSLIFWSLLSVVTLKYIVVTLRSDNAGEGGTLSLLALVQQKAGTTGIWAARFVALAALGTAMFYCEALITPAVTVLRPSRACRS